jgi:hypothetical protein
MEEVGHQAGLDGGVPAPVVVPVKPPPKNAPKGPKDAAELINLHGKDRSNKLQSLRVTRNAAVKILTKNSAKLRKACQQVLDLQDEVNEIKSEGMGAADSSNAGPEVEFDPNETQSRQRLVSELRALVEDYKMRCIGVRNQGRIRYPDLFNHSTVLGLGCCAPSASYQTFEWQHTKLRVFAEEFKLIFTAMYSNENENENRIKPKSLSSTKKRSREDVEQEERMINERMDKLKRTRRSAFETRTRVNEALKRQTERLYDRLEAIADMLNWSSLSSETHPCKNMFFDQEKAIECEGWGELREITHNIVAKVNEIRNEWRISTPESLSKPSVLIFAGSAPCSDWKEYDMLNSANKFFEEMLLAIFRSMFINDNLAENAFTKKVGRPRVHAQPGITPNNHAAGAAGVTALSELAGNSGVGTEV